MPFRVKQDGCKWRIESQYYRSWTSLSGHYKTKKHATQVVRKLYALEHDKFPSGKKKR